MENKKQGRGEFLPGAHPKVLRAIIKNKHNYNIVKELLEGTLNKKIKKFEVDCSRPPEEINLSEDFVINLVAEDYEGNNYLININSNYH